jgi:alanine dehydrogenase
VTLILNNAEIDGLLDMGECISVLEDAYQELDARRGINHQRTDSMAPIGDSDAVYSLKTMDGVIPKLGVSAVRISSDVVTWPEVEGKRRRVKVPAAPGERYVGLVLLFSTTTGEPLAIFPDGVVQRMRVAGANGIWAKYLARENTHTVGLLGSGWQAGSQIMAIAAVRDVKKVLCFSPNRDRREAFCREMSASLDMEFLPVASAKDATKDADAIVCATSSINHILSQDDVQPGQFISSIKLAEIAPVALSAMDKVAIHLDAPSSTRLTTEGLKVVEVTQGEGDGVSQSFDLSTCPTAFDLLAGRAEGRTSETETTCFLNNVGLGYQFAAIGSLLVEKAREQGVGNEVPTDWFTEKEHL